MMRVFLAVWVGIAAMVSNAWAVPPYQPAVQAASDEAKIAMDRFQVPSGFSLSVWAAEPQLANPVAFCFDDQGRMYVAETFRLHAGVTDIRYHMHWLDDDLASRTVEDRRAMYRKYLKEQFDTYASEHDRIKFLADRDGDGKADFDRVFADGFNDHVTGIGASLLARDGEVFYTCIPDLWKLKDTDDDGQADERQILHKGYGVHVGFLGHDLHGLTFGPDGKLYFSIGDRGIHVRTQEGNTLHYPDTGTVLRCNPDGSQLEVFASGFRNPQELAFDEYGNLFTGDNNSDSGDKARWVYIVEGGDSGWRIGYQFMQQPVSRGPWNAEKLWYPHFEGQAAYLVPPIANISDGPSGLCYDPGTGLPEEYRRHFFLADFRGGSPNSGIRSFAVKPQGAAFELVDSKKFLWSILATDVDFGPDGAMYVTDWTEGWRMTGKGRVYRLAHPDVQKSPIIDEVQSLLAAGFADRDSQELARLLTHADMRIRQRAQFALAKREEKAIFAEVARASSHQLARIHAIWGLGQLADADASSVASLVPLLKDDDPEIRAQCCKILGNAEYQPAFEHILANLDHGSPRVRFFAAIAAGKFDKPQAIEPLVELLQENADADPYLRHAGVMGLTGLKNHREQVLQHAQHESPAVRMGVLLAMRRWEDPAVAQYLNDSNDLIVLEAARAINDVPIQAAMQELASLSEKLSPKAPSPLVRRVLNARFRSGSGADAAALSQFAANSSYPEAQRLTALEMLETWSQPSGRDAIVGLWRPLPQRPFNVAQTAYEKVAGDLLQDASAKVRTRAAEVAGKLKINSAAEELFTLVQDSQQAEPARVAALKALEQLRAAELPQAVQVALVSKSADLRSEGTRLLAALQPAEAMKVLPTILESGTLREKQSAFKTLAEMKSPQADQVIAAWAERLVANKVPAELQLDVLAAAEQRNTAELQAVVKQYQQQHTDEKLSVWKVALAGGNAERGEKLFFENTALSCLRCHRVNNRGGFVGPNLSEIGKQKKRDYLLESIVLPSKTIAKGFETVIVILDSGLVKTGVLREETPTTLNLITAEGKPLVVPKEEIEERLTGPSAMPEDLIKHLDRFQMRDLIEYLASLKKKP